MFGLAISYGLHALPACKYKMKSYAAWMNFSNSIWWVTYAMTLVCNVVNSSYYWMLHGICCQIYVKHNNGKIKVLIKYSQQVSIRRNFEYCKKTYF